MMIINEYSGFISVLSLYPFLAIWRNTFEWHSMTVMTAFKQISVGY